MTEAPVSASIAARLAIARRYLASHPSEATSQDTAARARLVGGLRIDVDGPAGPLSMALAVRMDAEGIGRPELEAIVGRALRRSPVSDAVRREIPVEVQLA